MPTPAANPRSAYRGTRRQCTRWCSPPTAAGSRGCNSAAFPSEPLLSCQLTASLCAVAAEYPVLLGETLSRMPLVQVSSPQFVELPWRDQPFVTVGGSSAEHLPWATVAEVVGNSGGPNVRKV
eukprot:EG_transcript_53281